MIDIKNCFTYTYSAGTVADFYQTVTAAAASTNVIDLWGITALATGETGIRITGKNGPYLIVRMGAAAVTTVSMEIRLVSSTSTTMTGATVVGLWRFTLAQMALGALLINQQLPIGKYYRYLGLYFSPFTSLTAGTVLAYLSSDPEPAELMHDMTEAAS
jgi:hypothetical protein